MEEKTPYHSNIGQAQAVQSKFDFFFTGLIFSTLALAINTTNQIPGDSF